MFAALSGNTVLRWLCLAVVLIAGTVRPARCQMLNQRPTDDAPGAAGRVDSEAHRLYEEGLAHYQRGEYAAAIARLEDAYARAPVPMLLYNLAQAHRLNHDCSGARDLYLRFLDSDAKPTGTLGQRAETLLREMDGCLAASTPGAVSATPPAEVRTTLDASTSGGDHPPLSSVGESTASPVRAPVLMNVSGGAARTDPHRTRGQIRAPGAVIYALAGAALGLGSLSLYFAWRTMDASHDVSQSFRPGNTWDGAGMAAERRGDLSFKLELATAGGALIAGGLAAWLYYQAR